MIVVPIISLIDDQFLNAVSVIPNDILAPYGVIIILLILFVILPAMSITFSRIYLILTAQDEAVYDNDDDDNEEYTIKLEVDYDES